MAWGSPNDRQLLQAHGDLRGWKSLCRWSLALIFAQNTQDPGAPGTCQKTSVPPLSCSPTVSTPWIWNWVEFIIQWRITHGECVEFTGRSKIFRIAIQFESPAIAKERGDYRYQLLDLCSSLRIVDGEEPSSWLVHGNVSWKKTSNKSNHGPCRDFHRSKGVHPTFFWPLMPSETHSGEQQITFRPVGPRQTLP